jgi:hypothetical protein
MKAFFARFTPYAFGIELTFRRVFVDQGLEARIFA